MEIKKLLTVLVLGGSAIATTQCGPATPEGNGDNHDNTSQGVDGGTRTDGGTQAGGGDEGGGPEGW